MDKNIINVLVKDYSIKEVDSIHCIYTGIENDMLVA
jgi:hypothetical protein